jgi:hypothetical protein
MYESDELDQVVKLKDVPQSSVGAPIPIVLAGEHDVMLAYYLENVPDGWDGTTIRIVSSGTEDEPVAIVRFKRCLVHMFGPPNDESFSGHPLSSRGLGPYGAFEIVDSSWLRILERMNSVHEHHDKKRFLENRKHFIFSFHDSTFECIAEDFTVEIAKGSVKGMVAHMLESVR